jgi:ElaB/YqjD/DUF883 family membrane-anchored ribosome-binding protein
MANVDEEVTKLRKDMDQLRSDIGALTNSIKELGVQKGRAAINRARRTGTSLREEADAWRAKADHEIEEHPLTSVLMSFGIGFVIGMLLDRRR